MISNDLFSDDELIISVILCFPEVANLGIIKQSLQ